MSAKKKQAEAVVSEEKDEIASEEQTDEIENNLKEDDNDSVKENESETEVLQGRIKALEDENTELKNQYLRKQADFENFRKRMFREKEDSIKYANGNLLGDLLDTIDDFERAIKSSEESKDFESFYSGIVLIEKQLVNMLERKWSLKRFDDLGEEFDPQKHEALMMEETEGSSTPVVLEVYQKGYKLNDRVIRPVKVKVSKPAENNSVEEDGSAEKKDSEAKNK